MINIRDQNKKYISIYETQNWPSGFFRFKKDFTQVGGKIDTCSWGMQNLVFYAKS